MLTKINLSALEKPLNLYFDKICAHNPELKLELSALGELIVMSPTGGETGSQNARLIIYFGIWNEANKLGELFDSSTCFKLPNGALRSPDVSWIVKQRWQSLTTEQQKKFPPLAPDFVVELMSESDLLRETQGKMTEYIDAGVRLGWLLNPQDKTVEIYRPENKEVLTNPQTLSAEDVLPGFILYLAKIWG